MLGVWAGVATIATVFVYIAQAYLMRETMVHTNRAYVHVGTWDYYPSEVGDDGQVDVWVIAPRIENAGSTPTRNLIYSTTIAVTDKAFPKWLRFIHVGEEHRTLVGPKQYFRACDFIAKTADLLKCKSQVAWYYMYGWVEYDDVFYLTRRHRTEFCYRIFVYGDPFSTDCKFGFHLHDEYNNADDECRRQRKIRDKMPPPSGLEIVEKGALPPGTPLPSYNGPHSAPPAP